MNVNEGENNLIEISNLWSLKEFIWLEDHSVGHLENVVFSNNNNIHDCIFRDNSFQFQILTELNYENNSSLSIFIVWQEQENYKVGLKTDSFLTLACCCITLTGRPVRSGGQLLSNEYFPFQLKQTDALKRQRREWRNLKRRGKRSIMLPTAIKRFGPKISQ